MRPRARWAGTAHRPARALGLHGAQTRARAGTAWRTDFLDVLGPRARVPLHLAEGKHPGGVGQEREAQPDVVDPRAALELPAAALSEPDVLGHVVLVRDDVLKIREGLATRP